MLTESEAADFIRLDGTNGATFFLNRNDAAAWQKSWEFYRALTPINKLKKLVLIYSLPLWRYIQAKQVVIATVNAALSQKIPYVTEFGIDNLCSAMISPTRDKVIIHHHGRGYHKFAANNSFTGVAREIEVYRLLGARQSRNFCISTVTESSINHECQVAEFFMQYAVIKEKTTVPTLEKIREGLIEFFSATGFQRIPWRNCWNQLALRAADVSPEICVLIERQLMTGEVPVGLVHRDFKPWNIKSTSQLQFFDFEETVFDGLPLEDFFNYQVDPLIRYLPPNRLVKIIGKSEFQDEIQRYFKVLDIDDDWRRFWHWYLLERCVFWSEKRSPDVTKRYQKLYEYSRQYGY